jgi:peptidyl-prolyl cis-trans isomerase D
MFDFIGKHKRVVQVILALITLPFAFFGVDYYFRQGGGAPDVATVGGVKITQTEFDNAIGDQQERMRQQLGASYDPAMFDNPEVRYSILEQLINRTLMHEVAAREVFRVPDVQLQQFIAGIPAFQDNGKFSPERYREVLAAQNMTPAGFEQRLRQDLLLAPVTDPIAAGNIVAKSSAERYLSLLQQKREVAAAAVDPDQFLSSVKIDDAAVKAHYDANPTSYKTPELAKFEYLVLDQDALASQTAVDPAEVKAQYENNRKAYTKPEERDASHILIAVKPDAKPAEKEAARKKAEDLYAQVKANPAKFAELAKKYSDDPGSAVQGGDLGLFQRGNMVKPFDDAVFGMKVGDIVGPIETNFGYHVIKLNAINPAQVRPFDEVKAQIEADIKTQKAAQKFASAADQFQNLVYEQADSLQGAAKALGLKLQTTDFVTRAQAQALARGSAKFVQALFSPESIQSKRNTEAIEIARNVLMAGRILDFKPAAVQPFADVAAEIRRQLTRKAATEMAQNSGREKLAQLEQGKSDKEAGLTFAAPVTLARNEAQAGFPPDALTKIFQVDPAKVPQYTGALNEKGGFSIYRVVKVIDPPAADPAKLASAGKSIGDQIGRELLNGYLASLKASADVKINQANLEKKTQN